ncbi:MAG: apolipoprotein N-acyltransferase [Phycisphaerae bacterium]
MGGKASQPRRTPGRAAQPSGPVQRHYLSLNGYPVRIALLGLSLLLQSLIFPPIDLWPLAFVCLVPWFVATAVGQNATVAYISSYLLGLAFWLVNLRWLGLVTVEGFVALSAYLAIYFPLVACPLRHAVRRRGLPLALIAPVAWVAAERCQSMGLLGFPWFFMGHTQYKMLTLIQISDLGGAYAVSFVVVAINGAVADFILGRWKLELGPGRRVDRSKWAGPIIAACLLIPAIAYGQFQLRRDTQSPGPRVAVLQQDYPSYTDAELNANQPNAFERAAAYSALLQEASQDDPDLYLLPETPWSMALNPEIEALPDGWMKSISKQSLAMLGGHAHRYGAYVVSGGMSIIPTPLSLRSQDVKHNSAFVFAPDEELPGRYDKIRCVPLGEQVPFRFSRLRFLYLWLDEQMPFHAEGYEYSLTPGTEYRTFSMNAKSEPGRSFWFAVPICYEDVTPYICRHFVTNPETKQKQVDFLLNISNDGWFLHSDELPQHLAICAFRAVENRVPIARAVNTGISGFIDSNGRIHDLVTRDGRHLGPGISGYAVARLEIDSRHSLYSRVGDKFALFCGLLSLLIYVDYFGVRALGSRRGAVETEQAR